MRSVTAVIIGADLDGNRDPVPPTQLRTGPMPGFRCLPIGRAHPDGRVLLAGDAPSLVSSRSGEGKRRALMAAVSAASVPGAAA